MEYAKAQEIRDRIAISVCSRIRSDRERASADMRQLLDELEAHLFEVEFDLGMAYGLLDRSEEDARREFHLLTGTAPKYYLRDLRLQVAQRLLETTALTITMISELAGYGSVKSIGRAFQDRFRMSPSDYRRHYAAAEVHFPLDLPQKLQEGRLEEEEARVLMAYLRSHHPEIVEDTLRVRFAAKNDPSLADARSVSTQELEQLLAERLWEEIEHLPREAQESKIRQATLFTFRTPALFEFLRKTSIRLGRENQSLGMQVAELALIAAMEFEKPDLMTGKSSLWARAWAILGNSRRLLLKLDQSARAFEQAEYYLPDEPDAAVLGEILDMKALLCWYQRSYAEGLALEERAIQLLDSTNDPEALSRALIDQAILFHRVGNLEKATTSLTRVLHLLSDIDDTDIIVSTHYTLAQHHRELGKYEQAGQALQKLRRFLAQQRLHTYDFYLEWFEGRLALDQGNPQKAEEHLSRARSGFSVTGAKGWAGLVALDLAISLSKQGKDMECIHAVREALTVLELWKEHPQLGNLWKRLKRSMMARAVSVDLLIEIRSAAERLQEDPASHKYLNISLQDVS